MLRSSKINGLEDGSMDSFEDVDLDSLDESTQNGSCDGQDVSRHVDGPVDLAEARDSGAKLLIAKNFRVPCEEAYQQAFLYFHAETGTPYPCNQSDLDVHNTGAFLEPNNRLFVSAMEATREVMLHNHVTRRVPPTELVAIDNLRKTVYALEKRMEFGPDLAVKVFADLDLLFFGGQLRDNVRVEWVKASDHPRFAAAPERIWGLAKYLPEHGKCLIRLNADLHLRQDNEDPLRAMFGTLLHEMCHAYKAVRCGRSHTERRGHDRFFGTRIAVVHKRALRCLGLWAIGKDESYRQYHFFPGEQTATGMLVAWMMDVVLDVNYKVEESMDKVEEEVDAVAETAARGMNAVKR